jgi:hypothetical protein
MVKKNNMSVVIVGACFSVLAANVSAADGGVGECCATLASSSAVKTPAPCALSPNVDEVNASRHLMSGDIDDATSVECIQTSDEPGRTPHTQKEAASITESPANVTAVAPIVSDSTEVDEFQTEVSYKQEDETLKMKSTFDDGGALRVDASYTQRQIQRYQPGVTSIEDRVRERQESLSNDYEGSWHLQMQSTLGNNMPKIVSELAFSSFDPDTSDGFGDSEHRLFGIGAEMSSKHLDYGTNYRSVGKNFKGHSTKKSGFTPHKIQPDSETSDVWVGRRFGNLNLKTFVTQFRDNLDKDPNRPGYTDRQAGLTFEHQISSWPYVGYTTTYSQGTRGISSNYTGDGAYEGRVETVSSMFTFASDQVNATAFAELANGGDAVGERTMVTYYLGGSYYPTSIFSITPDMTFVDEAYLDQSARTRSMYSSLSFALTPRRSKFTYTLFGQYDTSVNRAWYMDSSYYYTGVGIERRHNETKPNSARWSVQLGYDQYSDEFTPNSDIGGLAFWFKWTNSTSPVLPVGGALRSSRTDVYSPTD